MVEAIAGILMPFFVLLMFLSIAGVRSDVTVKLIADLMLAVIRGLVAIIAAAAKGLIEVTQLMLMARLMSRSNQSQPFTQPRPSKVKVTVIDDGDN